MSFLGGIGDFFEDVVDEVVDFGLDIVHSVGDSVEGALQGDPMSIAMLAAYAYGAYALYGSIASSAAASTTTTATASTTASATSSVAAEAGKQVASQQVIQEGVKQSIGQLTLESGKKLTLEEFGKTIVYDTAKKEAAKMTLSEVLKQGAISAGQNLALTAVVSAFASPAATLPQQVQRPTSELFTTAPTIKLGAEQQKQPEGGISTKSSRSFENVGTLGRLQEKTTQTLRI